MKDRSSSGLALKAGVAFGGEGAAMRADLQEKYGRLREIVASYGTLAVAFSGGVDSSLLVFVAHSVLGDAAIAITADAPLVPRREFEASRAFCAEHGIEQAIVRPSVFEVEGVRHNAPDRCYVCKKAIFSLIIDKARSRGISCVADGSNLDDLGDYRPGLAVLEELEVASPLRDAGFGKCDIRELSRELGLSTWDKRSSACLATRFPYGEELSEARLAMADAAEEALLDLGFGQVRVRAHGDVARIEVPPADFAALVHDGVREAAVDAVSRAGFRYVALDLVGYRTGSMNEAIGK